MHRVGDESDTKAVLCRYFMNGICTAGSNCKFSHDVKDKPSMVCKYYLKGLCSYGKSCRYDHVKPDNNQNRTAAYPKPVILNNHDHDRSTQDIKMVRLTKAKSKTSTTTPCNWAEAPEFVPGQVYRGLSQAIASSDVQPDYENQESEGAIGPLMSYSQAAMLGTEVLDELNDEEASYMLCPFAAMGTCTLEECPYVHGLKCDLCGKLCLHPHNQEQQTEHRKECLESHEKDMEYSFAVQRSEGVACGICLEVVKSKRERTEQRFGILPECNHAFCLACIRKWRNSTHTKNKIVRTCPLCRVFSGFVIPSAIWVEDPEEKQKLIHEYTKALSNKPCKYFNQGKGTCPFGSSCFYEHAYPDGRKEELKIRRLNTADGDVKTANNYRCLYEGEGRILVSVNRLWDFVQARENERIPGDENVLWESDSLEDYY